MKYLTIPKQRQSCKASQEYNLEDNKSFFQLGGATGHIGDPSGRSTDRVSLDRETIDNNISCIKKNLETVFENHKKYIWDGDKNKLQPIRYHYEIDLQHCMA